MVRLKTNKIVGIIFLMGFFLYSCKTKNSNSESKSNDLAISTLDIKKKPNVIFILADDLGYGDLSIFGQQKLNTPNIDKLAAEGMVFTNHYSGNTVCSPSRATLMTGQDPGHVYCRSNVDGEQVALDPKMTSLPRLFKNAGYATGAYGKWGLGDTFETGAQNPLSHGFDEFYGTRTQLSAHTYFTNRLVHNGKEVEVDKNAYLNDLIMDYTLQFIKKNASEDKPFFCYIPTPIPHAAMHAPKEIHDKWRKKFPEFDTIIGTYGAGDDEICPDVINPIAGFAAMMEVLDTEVGKIVATVKELGIDENTIIVFTSDNGSHLEGGHDPEFWNSNGPFRGHKRDLYEGGIRTPFIVRWPNKIKSAKSSDHISAFWDILPTMAEIIGQPIPEHVNGISMLPSLVTTKQVQKNHEFLFFEYSKNNQDIIVQALRMGEWKAVRNGREIIKKNKNTSFKDWPIELYNLSIDIGEANNVANKFPEIVKKAKKIMNEERIDMNIILENRKQ